MTPAERALLLAVARQTKHVVGGKRNPLHSLIAAVEAEAKREELEESASCATCAEYERAHEHECGLDDQMRGSNDLCGEWVPAEALSKSCQTPRRPARTRRWWRD